MIGLVSLAGGAEGDASGGGAAAGLGAGSGIAVGGLGETRFVSAGFFFGADFFAEAFGADFFLGDFCLVMCRAPDFLFSAAFLAFFLVLDFVAFFLLLAAILDLPSGCRAGGAHSKPQMRLCESFARLAHRLEGCCRLPSMYAPFAGHRIGDTGATFQVVAKVALV